ncbi:hypothetical protein M3Y99_00784300 [Aphelenchoides fujianensis]|nr:hypothetical protein M3Y99_00784300 [Aphelenchoides fujianensis]
MIVIMLLLNSWFPVVVVYVPQFRECKELALSMGANWNRVLHGMELCWSYIIPADETRTTSPNHLLTTILRGRTPTTSTHQSSLFSDDTSLTKIAAYQQNSWKSTCSRAGTLRSTRRSRQAVRRWLVVTTIHLLLNAPDSLFRLSSVIDWTPRPSVFNFVFALIVRLLYFAQFCFNAAYLSAIVYRRNICPQRRQTTPKTSNTRVGIRNESRRQSAHHAELLRRYSADPRASREPNLRYHHHLQVNQPLRSAPLMPSYTSDSFRSENLDLNRSVSSLNSPRSLSTEPHSEINQSPTSGGRSSAGSAQDDWAQTKTTAEVPKVTMEEKTWRI